MSVTVQSIDVPMFLYSGRVVEVPPDWAWFVLLRVSVVVPIGTSMPTRRVALPKGLFAAPPWTHSVNGRLLICLSLCQRDNATSTLTGMTGRGAGAGCDGVPWAETIPTTSVAMAAAGNVVRFRGGGGG